MESAVYGRMRIGRCVTRDFGLLGCKVDVLHLAHRWCSGKQRCTITLPNAEMAASKPCSELQCYLEASYTCLPAAMIDQSTCTAFHGYSSTSGSMYLSSSTSPDNPCGTDNTPWKIDAKPGQTVTLGVLDLTDGDPVNPGVCETLGFINEGGVFPGKEICAAGYGVEQELYTTVKNNVEVKMLSESRRSRKGLFFITYIVNGCTDLEAPPHTVYKRQGNTAIIGCTHLEKTWKLTCVKNQWEGVIGMCTQPTAEPQAVKEEELLEEVQGGLTSSIVVALVVAVMVLLSSIILTFGLVSLARRRERKRLEQIYSQSRSFIPKSCNTLQSRETLRSHEYQNTVRPFAVKVANNKPYPYRNIELPPTPDQRAFRKVIPEEEALVHPQEPSTTRLNRSDSDYGPHTLSSNVTMLVPGRLRNPDSIEKIIAPDYDSEEDDNYELHEGKKYHILERDDEAPPPPPSSSTNSIPRVVPGVLPQSLPRPTPRGLPQHVTVATPIRPSSVYARYVPQPVVPSQDESPDYQHLVDKSKPNQNGINIQNDASEADC